MTDNAFMPTADIIQIVVGEKRQDVETQTWAAHKAVLDRIPYFQLCLSNDFQERQNSTVHLPEDHPEVIRYILHYVYSQAIIQLSWNDKAEEREAEERERLYLAVEIYIAADKFGMEDLKNHIVDAFIRYHRYRFVCP